MAKMYRCSRCGRRYPSRLEMSESRKPDGTVEILCRQCQSTSRCEVCGFTSRERKDFGVRKVGGRWRVLCNKCIKDQDVSSGPAGRRDRNT